MDTGATISERFRLLASLLAEARDLLDARPRDGTPPLPIATRGWDSFLGALDDDVLERLESQGLAGGWPAHTPPSLLTLIERAREATRTPAPPRPASSLDARPLGLRESARKRAQVDAFTHALVPLAAKATRVVDVGAGHGHLTRAVAVRLSLPVLGLERDQALADRARSLDVDGATTFTVTDVLREGLPFLAGDLVIGLHACGELGDAMVTAAERASASIGLVACCAHRRRDLVRLALTRDPELGAALDVSRPTLGLANLIARDVGVEASRGENLAARERRLALRRLLEAGGPPLRPGAEIDGLNRRVAQRDLPSLVARAYAHRGLPTPTPGAIDEAARWAREHQARIRRMALPRSMLSRALELFVTLDRAKFLEDRGYQVSVFELFPDAISARNLVLMGRPV